MPTEVTKKLFTVAEYYQWLKPEFLVRRTASSSSMEKSSR